MDGIKELTITHYRTFIAMNQHEVVLDPTDAEIERILRESRLPSATDLDEFIKDRARYVIES